MNYQEKIDMIEASGLPDEDKAKMRQMVTLGDEVHEEAKAYIQAEYGLDDEDLASVQNVGGTILHEWGESFIIGLAGDESLSDEDWRRIVGAIMDYVKITLRGYWKAKKSAGLTGDKP